ALETSPVRAVLARAHEPERRVLRFYGASESAVARALAEAGGEAPGLAATVCARDFEIHVDLVFEAEASSAADRLGTGLRRRLDADVAVAVTGIAGPGGGTPEKPVGLVYLHAEGTDGSASRELNLPGDRSAIRGRATAAALHVVRTLLAQS